MYYFEMQLGEQLNGCVVLSLSLSLSVNCTALIKGLSSDFFDLVVSFTV
jgi:hypothetical protein